MSIPKKILDLELLNEQREVFIELMKDKDFSNKFKRNCIILAGNAYNIAEEVFSEVSEEMVKKLWIKKIPFNYKNKSIRDQIESYMFRAAQTKSIKIHIKYSKESYESEYSLLNLFDAEDAVVEFRRDFKGVENILTNAQNLILHFKLEGKKHKEIAVLTGLSISAVGNTVDKLKATYFKYAKAVMAFEKYKKEVTNEDLHYIAQTLDINKRTLTMYYNTWRNSS